MPQFRLVLKLGHCYFLIDGDCFVKDELADSFIHCFSSARGCLDN